MCHNSLYCLNFDSHFCPFSLILKHVVIGLDIQDEMGRHEVGHIDNSMKIPLNNGDGCRFEGHFSINKASRNHVLALGKHCQVLTGKCLSLWGEYYQNKVSSIAVGRERNVVRPSKFQKKIRIKNII